jgi:tetratricopeptide (TPR) repeat protein
MTGYFEILGQGGYRRQITMILPVLGLLVLAAALWLNIVYGMRIKELQYRLKNNSDQQQSVRTLSLISRYQLLRQKAGERDSATNYGREGRLMQALQHSSAAESAPDLSGGEIAALWTIEFFNILAASPRFKYEQTTTEFQALERAFYFELRRNYEAAAERYDWALRHGQNLGSDWHSYAKLHRAFCFALANKRKESQRDLEDVILKNPTGEYRITAQAMLTMVSEIDHELVKIELMAPSSEKGAALYRLTAYDQAIETFKGLGNIRANPSALFYLGRSHEESGNNTQAAENYRSIIALHAKTEWAIKANRRLFAMGAFYTAGQEYRHESKSNVEKKIVNDASLLQESKRYERVAAHIEKLEREKSPELSTNAAPLPVAVMKADVTPAKIPAPAKKQIPRPVAAAPITAPFIPTEKDAEVTVAASEPPAPAATTPSAIALAKTWEQREALSRKDKRTYLRMQKMLQRVTMKDGNQFTGILMRETPVEIFLFTVMGKIAVDKSQVSTHEKVTP